MRERLERRLGELRTEYQAGERAMARLQAEQQDLQQTLLRISGAIQILEEFLDTEPQDRSNQPMATTLGDCSVESADGNHTR